MAIVNAGGVGDCVLAPRARGWCDFHQARSQSRFADLTGLAGDRRRGGAPIGFGGGLVLAEASWRSHAAWPGRSRHLHGHRAVAELKRAVLRDGLRARQQISTVTAPWQSRSERLLWATKKEFRRQSPRPTQSTSAASTHDRQRTSHTANPLRRGDCTKLIWAHSSPSRRAWLRVSRGGNRSGRSTTSTREARAQELMKTVSAPTRSTPTRCAIADQPPRAPIRVAPGPGRSGASCCGAAWSPLTTPLHPMAHR